MSENEKYYPRFRKKTNEEKQAEEEDDDSSLDPTKNNPWLDLGGEA